MTFQRKNTLSFLSRSVFTLIIAGFFLGLVFREKILTITAWALVQNDDPPARFQHIVLLMGDSSGRRAKKALSLWQKNPDAKIVFMREKPEGFIAMGLTPGRDETHRMFLLKSGVPAKNILIVDDCLTTSTRDEASCLRNHLDVLEVEPTSLLLVTEWYHSSRASWIFEKTFSPIHIPIYSVPASLDDQTKGPDNWWRDEEMFLHVFEEYLKWAYWAARFLLS